MWLGSLMVDPSFLLCGLWCFRANKLKSCRWALVPSQHSVCRSSSVLFLVFFGSTAASLNIMQPSLLCSELIIIRRPFINKMFPSLLDLFVLWHRARGYGQRHTSWDISMQGGGMQPRKESAVKLNFIWQVPSTIVQPYSFMIHLSIPTHLESTPSVCPSLE